MANESFRVITDSAVPSAVLNLISSAQKHIVLVSPYNSFWGHLKDEIRLAIRQRGVRVVAFYNPWEHTRGDGVEWLISEGAEVFRVNYLHAKLYLNESSAILTSMNLTEGSSRNSMDIGMLVDGRGDTYDELLSYTVRLTQLGERVDPARVDDSTAESKQAHVLPAPRNDSVFDTILRNREKMPKTALRTARAWLTRGRCIRCQKIIPYDADNPLCEADYAIWNQFKRKDYREQFCHKCGKQSPTTYARPLCPSCYSGSRSRLPFRVGVMGGDNVKQSEGMASTTERDD